MLRMSLSPAHFKFLVRYITIRPVLPTGTTEVTYSQPFTTVDNRSLTRKVHALITQPHVYVCMFN